MDSELDRTYNPYERNEEFERYLDEIHTRELIRVELPPVHNGMQSLMDRLKNIFAQQPDPEEKTDETLAMDCDTHQF